MSKARIIERTSPNGIVEYVIQQRHFLFRWWWVDAWMNAWAPMLCRDSYPTLEEAKKNLCWFDGTRWKCKVVYPTHDRKESVSDET